MNLESEGMRGLNLWFAQARQTVKCNGRTRLPAVGRTMMPEPGGRASLIQLADTLGQNTLYGRCSVFSKWDSLVSISHSSRCVIRLVLIGSGKIRQLNTVDGVHH